MAYLISVYFCLQVRNFAEQPRNNVLIWSVWPQDSRMALRIHAGGTPTIHLVGPGSQSTLSPEDQVKAELLFEAFSEANSLKNITSLFQKFCECVKLRPNDYRTFYTRLKERMSFSWKWKNFQGKLDKRTGQKDYGKGTYCSGNKVGACLSVCLSVS